MSGIDAYRKTQAVQATPRQTEADILLRVGREMELAQKSSDQELMEAMMRNITLWQLFAFDCAEEDNQLPQALRHQIISLAAWVVRQSDKVMVGEATPDTLIEINRTIARGLMASDQFGESGEGSAEEDTAPTSANELG